MTFQTSPTTMVTLEKLGEDLCGVGVTCWLVPGNSRHGVGKGQTNLFNIKLADHTEHLLAYEHIAPMVVVGEHR